MTDQKKLPTEVAYHQMHRGIRGEPTPAFEDPSMLEKVWGRQWGLNNDVGKLRTVLVSRPDKELEVMLSGGEYVEELDRWIGPNNMWYWDDKDRPNPAKIQAQHDSLVKVLEDEGVEVLHVQDPLPHMTKSVFTRDPAIIVPGGAIVCRLGVSYRRGEELPFTRTLANLGIPILRTIQGTGLMEGGSFSWLNDKTAVVGIGHRSNQEGARQLAEALKMYGVELLFVDIPGYGLHIDGAFLMVDTDKALTFIRKLPWWFLEKLEELGIQTIEADPEDGPFGVNCLAVSPGRVIMASHAEGTADRLHNVGVEVIMTDYSEIHKSGGGVHCSTLPLIRDAV